MIESIDLYRTWEWLDRGDLDALEGYLREATEHLVTAGCEIICLTAATMHIVYDRLRAACPVPMISIPETAVGVAVKQGYRHALLLGTAYTMEGDHMKTPFMQRGLQIRVPAEEERALVAKRIAEELEHGIVKESTRQEFCALIARAKKQWGVDCVILGCTELPLLLHDGNAPLPCLDIMEEHIRCLIGRILE